MAINTVIAPQEDGCHTAIDFSLSELAAEALERVMVPLAKKGTITYKMNNGTTTNCKLCRVVIDDCTIQGTLKKLGEFELARNRAEAAVKSAADIIENI